MQFATSRSEALDRLNKFIDNGISKYNSKRNYDFGIADRGNVSCLSPYITHRLITEYPPAKYDHPKNMSMLFNQFNTLIEWYNSNKSEHCIIMEDDLCLDSMKYWNFDWDYLMENLPCNWDCIQLYASSFNKLNLNLTHRHNGCHGSACFMVTRHYVEKLIKMFCYEDKYKIQYNYGYDGGAKWNTFSKIQPTSPDFVPYNIGVTYTFPIFTVNVDLKIPQIVKILQ